MVALALALFTSVLGALNANAERMCTCDELSQCMERKHDERRQLHDECGRKCGSRLGQYESAVRECKDQGSAQRDQRKQKRREMHTCVMREEGRCTDGARFKRQDSNGRQRRPGKGGRRRGFMGGFMRALAGQLPDEFQDYRSCIRECMHPGGDADGAGANRRRDNKDGQSSGSDNRRGGNRGSHKGGRGRAMQECTSSIGCTISGNGKPSRDTFETCAQQTGMSMSREERGRHYQEKCKCITRAFGNEQDCEMPQSGFGGHRRSPRSVMDSSTDFDDIDDFDE